MSKCPAVLPADPSWNMPESRCDGLLGHGRIRVTYKDAGPLDDNWWDHYDPYTKYGWNDLSETRKV